MLDWKMKDLDNEGPPANGWPRMDLMTKLDFPPARTTFGDRSFAVNGPRVWNSLPASIHELTPVGLDCSLLLTKIDTAK